MVCVRRFIHGRHHAGLFLVCSLSSCTNLSTLQTAAPLAPDASEISAQAWATLPVRHGSTVLPAIAFRQGQAWQGEIGGRVTYPGNLQLDFNAALLCGRFAFSLGMGVGTGLDSLLVGSSGDDGAHTGSFDAFVPFIASYYIVPDYLSVHGTLRPQLWLVSAARNGVASQVFLTGALGLRAGKDFGVHVEAAPVLGTDAGFAWTGAAALFVRFDASAQEDAYGP